MKKITLLFLVSFLTIMSCDKDDPETNISGHVTTLGTEVPIMDAKVILYGGSSSGGLSNPGADLEKIDSSYTNADGFYEFIFDASAYPVLDLVAEKEAYFSKGINQGLVRGTNVVDFVMDPFAWLKLHFKDTSPVANNSEIEFWGPWDGGSTSFTGDNIDEFFIVKISGNKESNIHWHIFKDGFGNTSEDYVYCPAQDTTLFEIFY